MRNVDGKRLLATAKRAEVRHIPVQANKAKQALDEPGRLPQRQAEKDLHRQAGLDGSVAVNRLSTTLARRLRRPRLPVGYAAQVISGSNQPYGD